MRRKTDEGIADPPGRSAHEAGAEPATASLVSARTTRDHREPPSFTSPTAVQLQRGRETRANRHADTRPRLADPRNNYEF